MISKERLKIAVGIATAGRPEILRATLLSLTRQIRQPDRVVISAPSLSDIEGATAVLPMSELQLGTRGSSIQRNVILDVCRDCDVVVFFDDDFIACADYLHGLERIHSAYPAIAMITGTVLLDGVTVGGITLDEALSVIDRAGLHHNEDVSGFHTIYNGYGCNMSVNIRLASQHSIRFDEQLPLYGWLEDVDYSRSLARHGQIVRADGIRGVHLGVRSGRQPGKRLGYSQVANPIYICKKGNMSARRALVQISRNVAANIKGSLRSDPFVDRRGRVHGNLIALLDLLTGRLTPSRALDL